MLQMDKLKYAETVIVMGVKTVVSSKGMDFATNVNGVDKMSRRLKKLHCEEHRDTS